MFIEKIINNTLILIKNNNPLEEIIIDQDTKKNSENINKTILLLKQSNECNFIFNEFIKYDIINNILFDVMKVNTYDIDIKTVEDYLIFILFEKYITINKRLFFYQRNNNLLFDNSLEYLRKIKESFNIILEIMPFLIKQKYSPDTGEIISLTKKTNLIDILKIKNSINILSILFYENNLKYNNLSIKIAYIYKLYKDSSLDELKEVFNIYNKIIDNLNLSISYKIEENNFMYTMIVNNFIKEFENDKLIKIPEVLKNFNEKKENITILDYQDAIILLYEYIYNKKLNILKDNKDLMEELFDSIILMIKSNKESSSIDHKYKKIFTYNLVTDNVENYSLSEYDDYDDYDEYDEEYLENLRYKEKYQKIKINFSILKIVKDILLKNKDIDYTIFNDYDEINNKLIKIILNKYDSNNLNDINTSDIIDEVNDSNIKN